MLATALNTASIVLRAFAPRKYEEVWGDGFVDDCFAQIVSVRNWDDIIPDQYIQVHPKLVGHKPAEVVTHVEHALRSHRRHAGLQTICAFRSMGKDAPSELGWTSHRSKALDPPLAYLQSLDAQDSVVLESFLSSIQADTIPSYDSEIAERVAFLAAIHPTYFWPEAIVSHQMFTSLGWLGIFMRGRPALMLHDVAEFLADAMTIGEDGSLDVHPAIEKRIGGGTAALALRRHAIKRLEGHSHVHRFPRAQTVLTRPISRGPK